MNFEYYLMFFFIYSFLGWCVEVAYHTLTTGKFINRGFLNGPVCSIYGFGVILVLLLLEPFKQNLLLLFLASIIVATLLEFLTGFILEKFFHRKWWDYSNEPFNIKGYICLRFSLLWGIACLFVVKVIHPLIYKLVSIMPPVLILILLILFGIYYIVDNVVTILQIVKYSRHSKELEKIRQMLRISSDSIGKNLSDTTEVLMTKSKDLLAKIKKSRLVKAFPKLNHDEDDKDNKND